MRHVLWAGLFAIIGAMSFWIPDVLWHAVRTDRIAGIDFLLLSVLLPVFSVIAVKLLRRLEGGHKTETFVAASVIAGIWLFGPLSMAVSLSFSGGSFLQQGLRHFILISTPLLPYFLLEMSTYDGTLFAIPGATLALIIMSVGPRLGFRREHRT